MKSSEITSIILLAAATWFMLTGLATIFNMMYIAWPLRAALRSAALGELWIGVVLILYGLHVARLQGEEIRDALYWVFPVMAMIGTALVFLFT